MFIIKYALKRASRDITKCLILVLVSLSFTLLIAILSNSLQTQYMKLDDAYRSIEVDVSVTDKLGLETKVYSKYISLFNEENGTYYRYVKDLCLKRTIGYLVTDGSVDHTEDIPSLIGITRIKADNSLSPMNGVNIRYEEGYDDTLFQGNEKVCLISEFLYNQFLENENNLDYTGIKITEDGYISIYGYLYLHTREYVKLPITLRVAGIYTNGEESIYCPWVTMNELVNIENAGDLYSEGLKFTINDNFLLDQFKEEASEIFVPTGYLGEAIDKMQYAMTIMDSKLIQTTTSLKKGINILEKMKPILYIISLCIGFVACLLFTKNRKPEFANMRSMGTPKGVVFFEAFFEQSLFGITGTLTGIAIYFLIHGKGALFIVEDILIFLVCYLAGATIAVINITRINVMKIMKAKE
ncbi:MAG: hypothetical protein KA982_00395 [Clostridia bacterium]|nr:hypothetical protein [Clostridia bacterium]